MSGPARLVVAKVRGLHGLGGTVRVEVLTDHPEARFAAGAVLHREGATADLTIADARAVEDGPGWRLRFREIRDRSAAEALRDAYLEADVDAASTADPEAVFWHELIGVVIRDRDGRELGRIGEVYRAGAAEVYVVRGGPLGEFDLPAVRDIIVRFAPREGEIVVDETILALDAPPVDAPPVPPRRRPRWSKHGRGGAPAGGPGADA